MTASALQVCPQTLLICWRPFNLNKNGASKPTPTPHAHLLHPLSDRVLWHWAPPCTFSDWYFNLRPRQHIVPIISFKISDLTLRLEFTPTTKLRECTERAVEGLDTKATNGLKPTGGQRQAGMNLTPPTHPLLNKLEQRQRLPLTCFLRRNVFALSPCHVMSGPETLSLIHQGASPRVDLHKPPFPQASLDTHHIQII